MKIAVLADIHGNSLALNAVLIAAKEACVDELLIAGDLVGYYFHPDTVMELLEPWEKQVISGNHEKNLAEAKESITTLSNYEMKYGTGLRIALEKLSSSELFFLTTLPTSLVIVRDGYKILMCHGSPWDFDQYIYPDSPNELFQRCMKNNVDIVITGHTHYPIHRELEKKLFINPGSVGQPRDRKPGAAWALLDTESGTVDLRRESYDIQTVVDEAEHIHPELPYLSKVLLRQ
jgi:putative phosphoesterase